jgi:hypothetical protein
MNYSGKREKTRNNGILQVWNEEKGNQHIPVY